MVVGVDEVGRGPLAGPVVAAAVSFVADNFKELEGRSWWNEITDSKRLSEKKREELSEHIKNNSLYSIAVSSVMEIETINILQGSLLAMRRAVEELQKQGRGLVRGSSVLLVDGRNTIPDLEITQEAIVRGDSIIHSIAAASIIAKVHRDNLMKELGQQFPVYGLDRHKGYGTKFHIEAIKAHGLSPIHRASFCGNIV
ncbi:ribonuclease HII [bacterium]|nr:MAG: ribonuclease HII [bacterium]